MRPVPIDRRLLLTGLAAALALGCSPAVAQDADPGAIVGTEMMVPQRTVLAYDGRTAWTDAEQALAASFARLRAVAGQLGLNTSGPPIADYTDESETDFAFRTMLPVAVAPTAALPSDVRLVSLPGGAAIRFVHEGSFAELEVTYERIDDYLVARGLEPNRSLEEYRKDPGTPDATLTVDIFIFR